MKSWLEKNRQFVFFKSLLFLLRSQYCSQRDSEYTIRCALRFSMNFKLLNHEKTAVKLNFAIFFSIGVCLLTIQRRCLATSRRISWRLQLWRSNAFNFSAFLKKWWLKTRYVIAYDLHLTFPFLFSYIFCRFNYDWVFFQTFFVCSCGYFPTVIVFPQLVPYIYSEHFGK